MMNMIGDGNYGEVFKGRLWGTDVAVKRLKVQESNIIEELEKEIQILKELRHPNVLLYLGACTELPNIGIVTEWCSNGSLFDVLYESEEDVDFDAIISISMGIAQGMNYLHRLHRRIIHRDLSKYI